MVGVIRGSRTASGRQLALRADMDALTMTESNEFPWKSGKAGMMHGCGHDGHTAMLVGAARYLAETRNFDGTAFVPSPPTWKVRMVNCVPGSPTDCAAITPTDVPISTSPPVDMSMP